jgi:hypothetical protein
MPFDLSIDDGDLQQDYGDVENFCAKYSLDYKILCRQINAFNSLIPVFQSSETHKPRKIIPPC